MKFEKFYLISGLRSDSLPLSSLKKYPTHKEAVEKAKEIIKLRFTQGDESIAFYILECSTKVEPVLPEIKVSTTRSRK